jgi:ribose transport system substrate-binding protein
MRVLGACRGVISVITRRAREICKGGFVYRTRLLRASSSVLVSVVLASTLIGLSTTAGAAVKKVKVPNIAYLSFGVANSYDAPMLAAAQATAATDGAKLTVIDGNFNPATQYTGLQDAITSGKYQGIITQPIVNTNLIPLVKKAIAKGIKVVNIDQILGTSYTTDKVQVKGLSGNVVFVPSTIGRQLGQQVVAACASKNLNPCNIGYMYSIKGSTIDTAIYSAFTAAIANTPVTIAEEGQSFYTISGGLTAAQTMLQADPNIAVFAAADQGIEGTVQALSAAQLTGKVLLVGYGASAAAISGVESGAWFSDIAQAPATEGRLGVAAVIKAIRKNINSGALNPVGALPDHGIVTKADAHAFTAEWPG